MGLIKLLREGTWYVRSETDPRWNANGEAMVGLLTIPTAVEEHIDRMMELLGEPPDDLVWGYHKY